MNIVPLVLAMLLCVGCITQSQPNDISKLDTILVPEIEFREGDLSDVLEFVARASVPAGAMPLQLEQEITGNNFTYRLSCPPTRNDLPKFTPSGVKITLAAKKITGLELLREIVQVAGARLSIDHGCFTIQVTRGPTPPHL